MTSHSLRQPLDPDQPGAKQATGWSVEYDWLLTYRGNGGGCSGRDALWTGFHFEPCVGLYREITVGDS